MALSFWVGDTYRAIGTASFLHAFFSTVSYHLEPNGWGTNYPELMMKLYQGELPAEDADKVANDVREIRERLRAFPPNQVIWDIENLEARPPWGDAISDRITDLSTYFVTSDGKDFITVFLDCLNDLKLDGGTLRVE